jgi:hypothetical protein
MRRITAVITLIILSTGLVWSGQLSDGKPTIDQYFVSNQLTAQSFYSAENMVDDLDDELPISGDIYEFEAKSTKRAFFYSMLVPGAGQYYAGSRIKPFVFFGIEALLWTGYFVYDGKGDDEKKVYQAFANEHYQWEDFMVWWETLSEAQQDSFSHRLPWDEDSNRPIYDHEYYENIGKYDQFQIGWDDIPNYAYPPPYGDSVTVGNRSTYLDMRRKANDYYQNANTMIMLSLGNRIISAFEAALTAKRYNKGQKRFALRMKMKDYGDRQVPMLTMNYRF